MAPPRLASHIDMDEVAKLLEGINEHVRAFSSGDLKAREAAIDSCRSLALSLEFPSEAVVRMTWTEVGLDSDILRRHLNVDGRVA